MYNYQMAQYFMLKNMINSYMIEHSVYNHIISDSIKKYKHFFVCNAVFDIKIYAPIDIYYVTANCNKVIPGRIPTIIVMTILLISIQTFLG